MPARRSTAPPEPQRGDHDRRSPLTALDGEITRPLQPRKVLRWDTHTERVMGGGRVLGEFNVSVPVFADDVPRPPARGAHHRRGSGAPARYRGRRPITNDMNGARCGSLCDDPEPGNASLQGDETKRRFPRADAGPTTPAAHGSRRAAPRLTGGTEVSSRDGLAALKAERPPADLVVSACSRTSRMEAT